MSNKLIAAAESGDAAKVLSLLAWWSRFVRRIDANAKDNNGDTALTKACQEGHLEVLHVLLDKGADVSAKKNNGDTALMMASRKRHLEVLHVLLDKGADVNAKKNNGDTALMMASRKGHFEVLRVRQGG
jgi:ankyrin repeat protein